MNDWDEEDEEMDGFGIEDDPINDWFGDEFLCDMCGATVPESEIEYIEQGDDMVSVCSGCTA